MSKKQQLHHNSIFIKSIQDSDKKEFLNDLKSLKDLYEKFLGYIEFKPSSLHNKDDEYFKKVAKTVHSPIEPLLEKEISEEFVDGEDKLSKEDLFRIRLRHVFPVKYTSKDNRVQVCFQGLENNESYDLNTPYGKIEGILDIFDKLTSEFSKPTSLEEVKQLKSYIDTINELAFILHKMYYVTGFYPDVAIDILLMKLSTLKESGVMGMDATLTNRYIRSVCEDIKHLTNIDRENVENFIVKRLDSLTRKKSDEVRLTATNGCFVPEEKCVKDEKGVYKMKENEVKIDMDKIEVEDTGETLNNLLKNEMLNSDFEVTEIPFDGKILSESEKNDIRESIDKRINKSRLRTILTVLGICASGLVLSLLAIKFKERVDSEQITDLIKQI